MRRTSVPRPSGKRRCPSLKPEQLRGTGGKRERAGGDETKYGPGGLPVISIRSWTYVPVPTATSWPTCPESNVGSGV